MQLVHELLRTAVHAGAHAYLLQERHQALVAVRMGVGEHLAEVARVRQAPALGHAQEQPRQPVRKTAADDEQVAVLELVEKLLGRQVLALQRADELQHVLVGDDVGRRCRDASEQVVDDRPRELLALARQVDDAVRRVADDLGGLRAAEALGVDRVLQQRVEGGADEQVEIGDLRELAQCLRRREVGLAQDAAHARIGILPAAARREEPADDVVECVGPRQARGVHAELRRELVRDPVVQQPRPGLGLHLEQFRPDDRDDPALLDEVEQVVPGVVIETGRMSLERVYVAQGRALPPAAAPQSRSSIVRALPSGRKGHGLGKRVGYPAVLG